MKWQRGPAYLRRVIAAPVAVARNAEHADASAPMCVLVDAGIWCAGIAAGASVRGSQAAAFAVMALLNYGFHARRPALASTGVRAWTLGPLAYVGVLTWFLRGGLLELLSQGWALPPYTALIGTVIGTGLMMQAGNAICVASPRWRGDTEAQWRTLVIGVVGYAFLLRLVYSAQVELLPEEAYYWNYSRHLDIGYLDHPPLVAWLIRAGTSVFGDTEFGIRCGALCSNAVATLFLFRLTRNLFGEASALLVLVLAQVLPFFFMSGMLMTPDAPLTAAWAASLYFLERALLAGRPGAWIWAGFSLGVGLLSKYTIALLVPAAVLFIVFDPPSRRWLRRVEPYAAVLLAALVFAPVIAWNARHEWASFLFQTSRRLGERPRFSLHVLVGAAMVLITPTGFATIAVALSRARTPPAGGAASPAGAPAAAASPAGMPAGAAASLAGMPAAGCAASLAGIPADAAASLAGMPADAAASPAGAAASLAGTPPAGAAASLAGMPAAGCAASLAGIPADAAASLAGMPADAAASPAGAAASLAGTPPAGAAASPADTGPRRFVQWFSLVPLAVFVLFSLRHEIKLDWTGAPWVAALPLMAYAAESGRSRTGVRRWLGAWPLTVMLLLPIYGAGLYYLMLGIPGAGYSKHMELVPAGWREFGRQIDIIADDMRLKYGNDSLIVGLDRYAIASELAFYSHDQSLAVAATTSGHLFDEIGLMYERWFPMQRQAGRTLLLVAWEREALNAPRLDAHLERLDAIQEGTLIRNGHVVRRYYYRLAHGYRPSL